MSGPRSRATIVVTILVMLAGACASEGVLGVEQVARGLVEHGDVRRSDARRRVGAVWLRAAGDGRGLRGDVGRRDADERARWVAGAGAPAARRCRRSAAGRRACGSGVGRGGAGLAARSATACGVGVADVGAGVGVGASVGWRRVALVAAVGAAVVSGTRGQCRSRRQRRWRPAGECVRGARRRWQPGRPSSDSRRTRRGPPGADRASATDCAAPVRRLARNAPARAGQTC